MLPTFNRQMLDDFRNVFIKYGEKLNRDAKEIIESGEKFDTYKIVKKSILNILCGKTLIIKFKTVVERIIYRFLETIMGIQLNGQSEDEFSYHIDR